MKKQKATILRVFSAGSKLWKYSDNLTDNGRLEGPTSYSAYNWNRK